MRKRLFVIRIHDIKKKWSINRIFFSLEEALT